MKKSEKSKATREATIEIEYPGAVISVNHYKYRGGIYTRKEAQAWMDELGWLVKGLHLEEWYLPLHVTCSGRFKDKRSQPDLSNLSKVILDAIEETTGMNDRDMRWHDGKVEYGEPPMLWLNFSESDKELEELKSYWY